MELRHLRYFITLAEELNFTNAARRLHIVQPALSLQIKELEEELGGKLFHRDKRSVTLSEVGRVFIPLARKALDHVEYAAGQAKLAASGEVGSIRVGYSPGAVLSGLLGEVFRRYRSVCPKVELLMRRVQSGTQMQALVQGDVDVVFGMSNAVKLPANCAMVPLASYGLRLVMAERHPLAEHSEIPVGELRNESFIAYSEQGDRFAVDFIRTAVGFTPHIACHSGDILFLGTMVEAGYGVAVMPSVMMGAFPGKVVSRPLVETKQVFNVAAFTREKNVDPTVRRLVEIAGVNAKTHA